MYVFLSVLLAVLGLVMVFKPDLVYSVTESWKHNGSNDPSDFYILNIRIGGCIFAAVGVIGVIVIGFVL